MNRTRLKDIAEKTGVSIKTVSKVVNERPGVNNETRKLVLKAIEKYRYIPNISARTLKKNKSFVIGYIVPEITNEFFAEVALAIEDEFKKNGYSILIGFTNSNSTDEENVINTFLSRQVDGIILATVGTTGSFLKKVIKEQKLPLVVIDNRIERLKTNVVLHDNTKGAYLLTKHLIDHGYKGIAFVGGPLEETSGEERLEGYKKALEENNVKVNMSFVKISNWKILGGYNSTLELLKKVKKPRAICYANSAMALGGLKAIREMNLKVPNDIALVSFDNLDFTQATNPPLTTLNDINSELGRTAAKLLYNKIVNSDTENIEEKIIDLDLFIRESCGCKKERYGG